MSVPALKCVYCANLAEITVLEKAVGSGDLREIDAIIAIADSDRESRIVIGRTMELAAIRGQTQIMHHLKRMSISTNEYILVHAAVHGELAAMRLLCDWIPPYARSDFAMAMIQAAKHGQLQAMSLIKSWWKRRRWKSVLTYALIIAVLTDQFKAAKLLSSWGASFRRAISKIHAYREDVYQFHGDYGFLFGFDTRPSDDVDKMILKLTRWKKRLICAKQHAHLLTTSIALRPLGLPLYVELWLLEWAIPGPLSEARRVQLLSGLRRAYKLETPKP